MSLLDQRIADLSPEKRDLLSLLLNQKKRQSGSQAAISPRTDRQAWPLSFAQQRLWFLDQLTPDNPLYNIPGMLHLSGPLDVDALHRSLQTVVQRHETLRANFIDVDGKPVQFINQNHNLALPLIDLQHLPSAERPSHIQHLAEAEAQRPFNLHQDLLLRTTLLRLQPAEHLLLVTVHHIAFDGWSTAVFVRELIDLYAAEVNGRSPTLAPLPIQYADYAQWQRQQLASGAFQRQLTYWTEQLGHAPPMLELPTDRPRSAVQAHHGARHPFTLAPDLSARLRTLAQAENATLFMLLLAAFNVLLHRYTHQTEISVGVPVANRTRSEIEGLIGFFVNTLVMRSDLSGQPSFRQLLQRVRQTALNGYAHQDVPFEMLVEQLQPERNMSHMPLFQVMFELQTAPLPAPQLGDLQLRLDPGSSRSAKFDLTLTVVEAPHQLTAAIEYDTDLFDPATIQRMAGHFQVLLAAAAADPDQPIAALPLLTPAEQHQLLVAWNETAVPTPHHQTIHQLFAEQAKQSPQVTAVFAEDGQLSYAQLDRLANQLAHTLQKAGVQPRSIVALCLERSTNLIVGLLAILKAGGAYLPLDPSYPAERLAFMLADAQPTAILTQQAIASEPWLASQTAAPIISLDTCWPAIAQEAATPPTTAVTSNDLAYLIYTSGSTGQPKGVMIPHRAVLNLRTGLEQTIYSQLKPAPLRLSLNAPLSFDASVQQIIMLTSGHTLYLIPQAIRGDGEALLGYIRQHRLNVLDCVPSQLKVLLAAGLLAEPGWVPTAVLPGGEAIDTATWQQLTQAPHTEFFNMYGPTECTVDSTIGQVKSCPDQPTIGRPIANAQLYVLDPQRQPVPIGVPGELYIGGAGLAKGYLNQPKLTAERFVSLPLAVDRSPVTVYRTGDLVRYLPDGHLAFLGRTDHQVKIRGFRLELGEVEAALRLHPDLAEVVVLAQHTETAPEDKHLVAYFVPTAATAVSPQTLRHFLKEKLPDYMVPTFFVPLDALPLTPNRKIDRRRLPPLDEIRQTVAASGTAPRTPQEEIVAGLWATLLGIPQPGIHDNFFALGGHSLLATQLISRLRTTFQVDLPLRTLFEAPTIAELAAKLSQAGGDDLRPIEAAQGNGRFPLSFAQRRLWFLAHLESNSGLYNISDAVRLTGPLDVAAFVAALNAIVARHETLRSGFATDSDGQPVLHIAGQVSIPVPLTDISHLTAAAQQELIRQTAVTEANTPFELNNPPLLRLRLLQTAANEHVALMTMHHIISDGWSFGVLIQELAACYAQHTGQPAPPLPELPIQYHDFAQWQHNRLQSGALASHLAYWSELLADSPPLLELPTDRPRPRQQSFHGAKRPFSLPHTLTQQLIKLSQQEGATLFMTLLAAFQTLLHRYTGANIINIGSPIANRTRQELENLIGFFINTLVMQGDLTGEPTFRALLRQTRQATLNAYAHQDLPFEMVVDAVQPQRNLSHAPLFQVMFVLQNAPFDPDLLPQLTLEPLEIDNGTAKFDLTLVLKQTASGLAGSFEYNLDLFDPATIDRLIGHFEQLLQGIATNSDQPITLYPLLSAAERQTILLDWNDTAVAHPLHLPIHRLFEAQAARTSNGIALFYEGRTLTYSQLNQQANQLARYLAAHGVARNDIVGISMARCPEMIVAMLAIHKAGAAYLPLDPTYPVDRLAFMVADAQPGIILTNEPAQEQSGHASPAAAQVSSPLHLQQNVQLINLPSSQTEIAHYAATNLPGPHAPEDLAYLIYTSGSTGQPKGVLVHHHGLCNTAHAYITRLNLAPGSRLLQFFAYSFDGSVGDIFPALTAGATLYLPPQAVLLSPTDLHRYLQTHAITHILMTPSLLRVLPTDNLPALRVVLGGGEQLTRAVAARWLSGRQRPARRLVNGYGPTETTVVSLFHLCDDIADLPETAVSVPIGRPADNTQVYILDPHQQPVPIGVPGELYIAGAGVAHGYLNQPQLTAARFVSLPLTDHRSPMTVYRTGDRCRWRPDGTVEFLGRLDHQVKLRGFRIELEEVEAALTRCVGVETAVVTLHQSETRQQLAAYFTSPQNPPPTAQTLHQQLLEQLPAYMIPTSFSRLAALPRLPNGKIDRRALPAPSSHQDERVTSSYTAPGTPNEALLCAIWAELLSLEKVGIHDNFFALGGDSILTIQLVARARQAGLQLTPRQIFQFPTIAQLASQVGTVQLQAAEQGLVTGEAPLTPVQHWFFEQAFAEADHWNQALMLKLRQPLRLDWLETAVSHLIHHHDALRLRYTQSAAGWQQTHADDNCRHLVQAIDLSHLAPAAQKAELEEAANRLHASLNLQTGPLLRLLYCHLGPNQPDRLLLTIHHLVIDSLSWRILLADLQQIYQQVKVGKPVELPPKTTSFKQWANELATYARSADLGEEVAYWLSLAEKERPSPLPHDFPFSADANLVENGRRLSSTLSAQETEALLHDVPPIYGTQINDILLTALVEAVYRTTGSRELWLALEGHGREDMLPGIDLSRTVGWFTAIFPVYLSLQGANSPGDAIKQIKEQCRRIPNHGIGYGLLRYLHPDAAVRQQMAALPTPEISFNYLGQLDQTLDDLPFEPSQEAAGHAVSPRGHRPHLLAVNGAVFGGQLQLEWTYCHNVHRAETVGQLANQYMASLRELIAHCQQPTAGGYTPSDFPEVALSTADLDALLVEFSD